MRVSRYLFIDGARPHRPIDGGIITTIDEGITMGEDIGPD